MKKLFILLTALLVIGGVAMAEIFGSEESDIKYCPWCGSKDLQRDTVGTTFIYKCKTCGDVLCIEALETAEEAVTEATESCTECADHNCPEHE